MKGTTSRPASQGSPNGSSARNSLLGGSHENVDLVKSRGDWDTNQNIFPVVSSPQYFEIQGRTGDTPEDQPNNPYHTTPGQGPNNYQDSPAIDDIVDSALFLGFYSPHSQNDRSDADANRDWMGSDYSNRDWMGSDYSNHEHCTGFPPTHPADLPWLGHGGSESPGPIPRASHFVDQHSGAEQNYGFGPYGEDRTGFLDSGVAGRSYETASGIDLAFDISQATPIVSDEAVVTGPTDTISPPPAAMVGNRGATQAPAELSPMGVNNLEIKRSGRRKRSASPDGRDKGKHTQRKKRRHSSAREQPQIPQTVIPLRTRTNLSVVKQTVYQPPNVQNNRRLLPSINFVVSEEGRKLEGINLEDALNKRYSHLDGRDDSMFEDESIGNSVSCRVEFVGHHASEHKVKQIKTRNHTSTRDRVKKQELAHDVAKFVKNYLEKSKFHVRPEDVFLVKLHHVAQASWQPELWYGVHPSASS